MQPGQEPVPEQAQELVLRTAALAGSPAIGLLQV
jgi:hypothetical protein